MEGDHRNGNESEVTPEAVSDNQGQLVSPHTPPVSGGSPIASNVHQTSVPPVPMLQKVSAPPALVQSSSSAFQAKAPGTTNIPSMGNDISTASSPGSSNGVVSSNAAGISSSSAVNTALPTAQMSHLTAVQPSTAAVTVASAPEGSIASVPVPGPTAVSTLPTGSFYFMLQNSTNSIPNIAPRPPVSEGLTSPTVMTSAVRPDSSPVPMTLVPTSPVDGDGSMPPLKRARSGSPRESKRRAIHNEVERRRRDKINFYMDKLKEMIPSTAAGCTNNSKGHVLEKAVLHITELQEQLAKLQKKYDIEHDQLVQCASQHTLLRQQLLDSSLKPAFGLFKIANHSADNKPAPVVKVHVPSNVIACHTASPILPPTLPAALPVAVSNTLGQSQPVSSVHNLPNLVPGQTTVTTPPPLTVVTFSSPLKNPLPETQS